MNCWQCTWWKEGFLFFIQNIFCACVFVCIDLLWYEKYKIQMKLSTSMYYFILVSVCFFFIRTDRPNRTENRLVRFWFWLCHVIAIFFFIIHSQYASLYAIFSALYFQFYCKPINFCCSWTVASNCSIFGAILMLFFFCCYCCCCSHPFSMYCGIYIPIMDTELRVKGCQNTLRFRHTVWAENEIYVLCGNSLVHWFCMYAYTYTHIFRHRITGNHSREPNWKGS